MLDENQVYYAIGIVKMGLYAIVFYLWLMVIILIINLKDLNKKDQYLRETKQLDNYALWEDIKKKERKLRFLKFMRYDR